MNVKLLTLQSCWYSCWFNLLKIINYGYGVDLIESSLLCREAKIFLQSVSGQSINIPFIHGKWLLPVKLLQEKLCGTTRVIVEALVQEGQEFNVLAPLPTYAGVYMEAYFILEESLSKNYTARLEDIFQIPESSPIGPSPAPM
ncbi:hypothetical protein GOP47_0003694 [Adiantum capillus-veneris]|uniref:Uncharacterized protein n=1 Tax=Adiantum capillus-veneris TaxID=13818 RepID=A0A9D4V745_ADICA|nr:hypothetical protein GOP47_0003694 [Adiantum capillus-veneris]